MPPMPPLRKPAGAPEARMPLEGKIDEVAKANPKGVEVRVTARDADGLTYVQPPRRPREIVQPLEVDGEGRVSRARVMTAQLAMSGSWTTLGATDNRLVCSMNTIRLMR